MAFAGPSIQGANSSSSVVDRLGCLRGVSALTAFGLAVEIGDWQRLSASHRTARSGASPATGGEAASPCPLDKLTHISGLLGGTRCAQVGNGQAVSRCASLDLRS